MGSNNDVSIFLGGFCMRCFFKANWRDFKRNIKLFDKKKHIFGDILLGNILVPIRTFSV